MTSKQATNKVEGERYHLEIKLKGTMCEFAHLTLYNGFLESIYNAYGELSLDLPVGIYKLVLELNNISQEQYIRLDKNLKLDIEVPKSTSSFLASGFEGTHEYYSSPAEKYQQATTTHFGRLFGGSSLFIFFRYNSKEVFQEMKAYNDLLGSGFKLLDARRKLICELEERYVQEDSETYGWLAFNTNLKAGTYYLYYEGGKTNPLTGEKISAREIPVTLFDNWQTQLFMTFGVGPLFRSLVISFRELSPFHADNKDYSYEIEGILQKFVNGIYFLPYSTLKMLTTLKWKNPMLGLLAAHSYFLSKSHDKEELFNDVVNNLARMLGETAPDVKAIRIMHAIHKNEIAAQVHLQEPCMLLSGLKAAVASVPSNFPYYQAIEAGSLAEKTLSRLYNDMAWTSYEPITKIRASTLTVKVQRSPASYPDELYLTAAETLTSNSKRMLFGNSESTGSTNPRKPKVLEDWVANSILYLTDKSQTEINIPELASQLQLTTTGLTQTIKTILNQEEKIKSYLDYKPSAPQFATFNQTNIEKLKFIVKDELDN